MSRKYAIFLIFKGILGKNKYAQIMDVYFGDYARASIAASVKTCPFAP